MERLSHRNDGAASAARHVGALTKSPRTLWDLLGPDGRPHPLRPGARWLHAVIVVDERGDIAELRVLLWDHDVPLAPARRLLADFLARYDFSRRFKKPEMIERLLSRRRVSTHARRLIADELEFIRRPRNRPSQPIYRKSFARFRIESAIRAVRKLEAKGCPRANAIEAVSRIRWEPEWKELKVSTLRDAIEGKQGFLR